MHPKNKDEILCYDTGWLAASRLFTQTNAAVDIFMQPSRNESGDDAAVIKWLRRTPRR